MSNWGQDAGSAFNSSFANVMELILKNKQLQQEKANKDLQAQQEGAKNQIEMMKMGYSPSDISAEAFKEFTSNPNAPQPTPGQYVPMGNQLYRQNPALLANLQALKPNMGSNIIVPQSLMKPESSELTGEDVLKQLDPNTAEVVKGLTDYSLDPAKVTSMRGNQRMQVAGLAKRVDPTFNMQIYPARQKYMTDVYGGEIYKNSTSLNTLAAHLDNLDQAIENAKLSGTPLANVFILKARELAGDPSITDLKTAKEVIDSETQRALTNAAVTVEGMNQQRKLQKLDLSSYKQAKQYVKSIGHIASQRAGQMEEAFVQRMGKKSNGLITNPSAQKTFARLMGNENSSQSFTIKGKTYNISTDQVEAFKKDMGIK